MPRASSSFFINAKNILLTYPRCVLPKQQALDEIRNLQFPISPIYIRVAQETHENGSSHLHCLIQFEGKFLTASARFFDIKSPIANSMFHPNVQGARNSSAVRDYISKYGDFVEWGEFRSDGRTRFSSGKTDDVYAAALAGKDKGMALNIIKRGDPRSFIIHYNKLSSNLDRIFQKPPEPYVARFQQFECVPSFLTHWADTNVTGPGNRPHRPMSIIIKGPSRTGKTCWARSLNSQAHNYYAGHIDLAHHSDDAWYNVINDVNPQFLKHWKEFLGAQRDWSSNCKYAKPRKIKGGIPSIVFCNPGLNSSYDVYLSAPDRQDLFNWTKQNAAFFFLQQPLFALTNQEQAPIVQEVEELDSSN
ncbi:uncharacterized protein [Coffea arabica]|uniref:CRESS-DNA virus Rep endonuclease domain-containing protein n=1 Tax=Coffea arabica TaxID=13443 RepID=A0A6P6SPE1_COFAR